MAVNLTKRVNIDRDFILDRITDYDIYSAYYEMGDFELGRACLSPFKEEIHPSFIIGYGSTGDRLIHKSYNTKHTGDCFKFVMDLFGLDFNQALEKIARDFGLIEGEDYNFVKKVQKIQPEVKVHVPKFLQAVPRKWLKEDIEWWWQFYLTKNDLNFCDDTKVYATGEYAIDRKRQPLKPGELSYFYHLINERGSWLKIYRPQAETKKGKWVTSIPHREMHGLSNLEGCEVGFIQKSIKDGAFTYKYMSKAVACASSEQVTALTKENIDRINQSCRKVFIIFDGDEVGLASANELAEVTGWTVANPPSELLQYGITDLTDWAKATSPNNVIDYYKQKNII
jgi:hypothetical protein